MGEIVLIAADWQFRTLVRAQLLEQGYVVRALASVEDALKELIQNEIVVGLILVDRHGTPLRAQALSDLWRLAGRPAVILCAEAWGPEDRWEDGLPPAQLVRRPLRVGDLVAQVRRAVGCPEGSSSSV